MGQKKVKKIIITLISGEEARSAARTEEAGPAVLIGKLSR